MTFNVLNSFLGLQLLTRGDFLFGALRAPCGSLPPSLFEAGGEGGLDKELLAMKVVELRAALEARGEAVSGNKAWLRRRLHAAIIHAYLAEAEADGV